MGVGALLPAHEDATEAMQPRVRALDHPATCSQAGLAPERPRLVTARADVAGEAKLMGERSDLVVVVAAVETQTLRLSSARLRSLDDDRIERRSGQLEVVDVRGRLLETERDALSLGEERSLRPFFALSVGLGPVLSPPSGALPRAPRRPSDDPSASPTTLNSKRDTYASVMLECLDAVGVEALAGTGGVLRAVGCGRDRRLLRGARRVARGYGLGAERRSSSSREWSARGSWDG